jgi:NAD(P)-dependent dehydrogenase (short-subunit alcohol dehydrogenase family)
MIRFVRWHVNKKRYVGEPHAGVGAIQQRSIKRVEVPEDLVGTLLYLASPASEFLTGQPIAVNGENYLH